MCVHTHTRIHTYIYVVGVEEVERRSRCSIGVICAAISNRYVITTINIDAWIIQDVRAYVYEPSVTLPICVHAHVRTSHAYRSFWLAHKAARTCMYAHMHARIHRDMARCRQRYPNKARARHRTIKLLTSNDNEGLPALITIITKAPSRMYP